ncbi:hypothetical protein SDC9_53056 [bioreactor metagenome]|uniref:Peptidase M12B domain-containing protein n=1 Tax=bioreactor metagenome TaxID=1076179 RepID=A0A644WXI5_9ZZZZ
MLHIPLNDMCLQLELLENPINYLITTSDNQKNSLNKNIRHYHGIIKDDNRSMVAITFAESEVMGLVVTDKGHYDLVCDNEHGVHIFYDSKNIKHKPDFSCATDAKNFSTVYSPRVLFQELEFSVRASSDKRVRLYFETEYDIFQIRGSIQSVETFITGLYNQVALLYRKEGVITLLSQIHIWNTADPYSASTTGNLLAQFQNTRAFFNGDLGQLLTFRNIGGGQAAGFNGLCSINIEDRLSVAMLYNSYSDVPTYSWSAYVVTHEFGHLFGSRHTHACVWNGDNTAIDGCSAVEGNCQRPENPLAGGTIMSYCHLQNVGINFNLGFGSQPGNVIRNSVSNAACLISLSGTDIIGASCTGTYTFSNLPSGASFLHWEVGAGLTIVGSNASSCTVQRSNNVDDPEYSEVRYIYSINQQQYIISKTVMARILPVIAVGMVDATTHLAQAIGQVGKLYYFKTNMPVNLRPIVQEYEWELIVDGIVNDFSGENTSQDPFRFDRAGIYALSLRVHDGCEYSKWVSTNIIIESEY